MRDKWLYSIMLVGAITCLASIMTYAVYYYGLIDLAESEKKSITVIYYIGVVSFLIPAIYLFFLRKSDED